jgi:hypothetical protein
MKKALIGLLLTSFFIGACTIQNPSDYEIPDRTLTIKAEAETTVISSLRSWQKVQADTLIYTNSEGQLYFVSLNLANSAILKKYKFREGNSEFQNFNFDYPHLTIEGRQIKVLAKAEVAFTYQIPVSDSNLIEDIRVLNYYGAAPGRLNDTLAVIPILVKPKGKQLSKLWLKNFSLASRLALVDLKNWTTIYPFKPETPYAFIPGIEHPLIASSESLVYYCMGFLNEIWEFDARTGEKRLISLKSANVSLQEFDPSSLANSEYRLEHYQASKFATGLWHDAKSNTLIRRCKLSQPLKDAEGLNRMPYWADMVFEIINLQSGDIIRTLRIDGKRYSNRSCFINKGNLYIKDDQTSSDLAIHYGVFRYR